MKNSVLNIASPYNVYVLDFVKQIEKKFHKKAKYNLIKKGTPFDINIDTMKKIIKNIDVDFLTQEIYLSNLIDKYMKESK
jgi:hypothetical protein